MESDFLPEQKTTTPLKDTYFACLADLLGIEVISGVDSLIQFDKTKNFLAE